MVFTLMPEIEIETHECAWAVRELAAIYFLWSMIQLVTCKVFLQMNTSALVAHASRSTYSSGILFRAVLTIETLGETFPASTLTFCRCHGCRDGRGRLRLFHGCDTVYDTCTNPYATGMRHAGKRGFGERDGKRKPVGEKAGKTQPPKAGREAVGLPRPRGGTPKGVSARRARHLRAFALSKHDLRPSRDGGLPIPVLPVHASPICRWAFQGWYASCQASLNLHQLREALFDTRPSGLLREAAWQPGPSAESPSAVYVAHCMAGKQT